jgi:DNA invertase Pin-like site-specific DNA recombinase
MVVNRSLCPGTTVRFHRNAHLERLLDEYDIQLHTVEGQIDTSTPDGWTGFAMRAFLGEIERRQIKYRTKKAMEYKKRRGEVVGSVPYGYRRNGNGLEPDMVEQKAIKWANGMYQAGRSLTEIADWLQGMGYPTRNGKPWRAEQVKRVIEGYEGRYRKAKGSDTSAAIRQFIERLS